VRTFLLGLALATAACGPSSDAAPRAAPGAELVFEGSWNASGSRRTLSLGEGRKASLLELRGTLLLHGPERPGAGFRSEVFALADSATGLQGRSVWTDERGDRVFSELQGEGDAARNHIKGTIVGGTGRYAGVTGSYEFSWHSLLESEEGSIQGRAVDLKGRIRR
jgi:hypothetical protein